MAGRVLLPGIAVVAAPVGNTVAFRRVCVATALLTVETERGAGVPVVLSLKGTNVVVALFREYVVRDRLTFGVAVALCSVVASLGTTVVFRNTVASVTAVVRALGAIVVRMSVVFPEVGAVLWIVV